MQHLPKQALFLGRALKECLDCSLQPLPDELNILLEMLDGAERRRRKTLNTNPMVKLDLPADVHWIPADEISPSCAGLGRPHTTFWVAAQSH